ncbi:MAG: GAF and ANTAR domain-containing protein [Solirubrobacteraceae bacterium]
MASDRQSMVLTAMADAARGGSTSVVEQVCVAAAQLLALSGVGISLMSQGQLRGTAGVREGGIAMVQELELTLGEGPCLEAWARMEPVLEPDLANPRQVRWPTFAQSGVRSGVLAVFALPLHIGAIGVGVLALYRDCASALSDDELGLGLVLADVATQAILGLQAGASGEELHPLLAHEPAHWAEIHQATGMIAAQLEVPLDEAFVRLRSHAFADGRALREVANDVVARNLRLLKDGDDPGPTCGA